MSKLQILASGKTGNKKGKKRDAWITRKEQNPTADLPPPDGQVASEQSEAPPPPPPKQLPRSAPESPAKKFVDSQQPPEPSKANSKAKRSLTKTVTAGGTERYPAAALNR